jgi:phenylacetate-CoA ligase
MTVSDLQLAPVATPEELKALQLERLKWSVAHAYYNNDYYRRKFQAAGVAPEDIHTLEDLQRLPLLDKEELQRNYPFGLRCVPFADIVRIHASSGTTGKKTVVYYTQKDIDDWMEMYTRCFRMAGLTKEDRFQPMAGYGLWTAGVGFQLGSERMGMLTIPAGPGNIELQLELMMDFQTTCYACTSSFALAIAEEIAARGIRDKLALRTVILGSERTSDQFIQHVRELLGVEVYDCPGMTELYGPGIGLDCHYHEGIHYFGDYFIIEVVDPVTGQPLPEGEEGEMVATTLAKEAMPMIRYRTRDICRIIPEPCRCGSVHPRTSRILGRTDDMFKFRGVAIFPGQIEHVLADVPGIGVEYQVLLHRERGRDTMVLRVERLPGETQIPASHLETRISQRMKDRLGVTPKVEVVPYKGLPRSEKKTKRVLDMREG